MTERLARWIVFRLGGWLRAKEQARFDADPPCKKCVEKGQHCDYNVATCPLCGGF